MLESDFLFASQKGKGMMRKAILTMMILGVCFTVNAGSGGEIHYTIPEVIHWKLDDSSDEGLLKELRGFYQQDINGAIKKYQRERILENSQVQTEDIPVMRRHVLKDFVPAVDITDGADTQKQFSFKAWDYKLADLPGGTEILIVEAHLYNPDTFDYLGYPERVWDDEGLVMRSPDGRMRGMDLVDSDYCRKEENNALNMVRNTPNTGRVSYRCPDGPAKGIFSWVGKMGHFAIWLEAPGSNLRCLTLVYDIPHGGGINECEADAYFIDQLVFRGDQYLGQSGPFLIGGNAFFSWLDMRKQPGSWSDGFIFDSYDGMRWPDLFLDPSNSFGAWLVAPHILIVPKEDQHLPDIVVWRREYRARSFKECTSEECAQGGCSLIPFAKEEILVQHFDDTTGGYSQPVSAPDYPTPDAGLWDRLPGIKRCESIVETCGTCPPVVFENDSIHWRSKDERNKWLGNDPDAIQ